jgi:hypothetical protein
MQRAPASQVQAIYGDANVEQATILPDLAGTMGNNSTLSLTSNTDDLNNYQKLSLTNLFSRTKISYFMPQINTPTSIQFPLKFTGWTDLSEMVLELPVDFKITATRGKDRLDVFTGFGVSENNNWARMGCYPEFPFLQAINRFEIALGENSIPVGRQQMTFNIGLRHVASDVKLTDHELQAYVRALGSPIGHSIDAGDYVDKGGELYTVNQAYTEIPSDVLDCWSSILAALTARCQYIASVTDNKLGSAVIAIPLRYLNSAFREQFLLPPRTAVRVTMECSTDPVVIATKMPYTKPFDGGFNDDFSISMSIKLSGTGEGNTSGPRLICREHMLNEKPQLDINARWARQPMLINYETYEIIEQAFTGVSDFFEFNIAVSQQRPTQIVFKVLPPAGLSAPTVRNFGSGIMSGVYDFPDSACVGIKFSDLIVDIAGHDHYRYEVRSPYQFSCGPIWDGLQQIDERVNEKTYQSMDRRPVRIHNRQSLTDSAYMKVNLNPGDREQHAYLAQDKGAASIRVSLNVTNTVELNTKANSHVPAGYRLVVFKTLPEQFTLSAEGNVNVVSWPAITTNNGFFVQQTINTNN